MSRCAIELRFAVSFTMTFNFLFWLRLVVVSIQLLLSLVSNSFSNLVHWCISCVLVFLDRIVLLTFSEKCNLHRFYWKFCLELFSFCLFVEKKKLHMESEETCRFAWKSSSSNNQKFSKRFKVFFYYLRIIFYFFLSLFSWVRVTLNCLLFRRRKKGFLLVF